MRAWMLAVAMAIPGLAFAQMPSAPEGKAKATETAREKAAEGSAATKEKAAAGAAAAKESAKEKTGAAAAAADEAKEGAVAPLDINSATEDQLKMLPGVGEVRAKKIIENRPFDRKDQLVSKKILPKGIYDKIKNNIVAKQQ